MTAPRSLAAEGVQVRFGAFLALDEVSVRLDVGEVVGLIGPNGSGKTTLLNALSGVVKPTQGRVVVAGARLRAHPERAAHGGIARTFQNVRLFKQLTVLENVEVAIAHRERRWFSRRRGADAMDCLEEVGIGHLAQRRADTLSYGDQRRVEIARALALDPLFLLLDEPAAGMLPNESAELVDGLERVRERRELGLLVIDHDLRLIMRLCRRMVVLDAGRVIAAGAPAEIQRSDAVIAAYLGRSGRKRADLEPIDPGSTS